MPLRDANLQCLSQPSQWQDTEAKQLIEIYVISQDDPLLIPRDGKPSGSQEAMKSRGGE